MNAMNTLTKLKNTTGTGGLLLCAAGVFFAGYVIVKSIPDIRRYIRITTM